jgi:hypothetical protein
MQSTVETTLSFIDADTCEHILEALKSVEQRSDEIGVFQTDLWKEYRKMRLPEEISPFEGFKFDE